MSNAKDVTDASFADDVLNSSDTIMVDFWAEWCGPCRAVSPILDQIASEHSDKIKIVKLNVDDNPQMAMKYQITSIPAMKVFRDTRERNGRPDNNLGGRFRLTPYS
jgi:thioredoxin 1